MSADIDWEDSLYLVMALMGIDPNRLEVNLSHVNDEGEEGYIALGIPDNQIGFTLDGDHPQPFIDDGWFIQPLPLGELRSFDSVVSVLNSASFEDKRRTLSDTTKQTSRHEDWLLDAIIAAGLPTPNRNLRINRENGKELTTPDFAWEKYKVAFFVDGLWWHVAKDDTATMNMLRDEENGKKLIEGNKTRAEKDLDIRSQMQLDGWMVLSCTDRDLEKPGEPRNQAKYIKKAVDMRKKEQDMIASLTAGAGSAPSKPPAPPKPKSEPAPEPDDPLDLIPAMSEPAPGAETGGDDARIESDENVENDGDQPVNENAPKELSIDDLL